MTPRAAKTQGPDQNSSLTIGDLAKRTGLSPATLRMWETRHGFPLPERLDSGHRRYDESAVDAVGHVVRRRDAGVRLEAAIAEAMANAEPTAPSVFAELRRRHPHLATHRLRKSTLLALSWAIEDEFCARAEKARIFGGFQTEHYYLKARARWRELARLASSTMVFAEFPADSPTSEDPNVVHVALPPDAPMRREWTVVCDAPDLPVALTAWELPGQEDTPDRQRIFESMWTVEPHAVRDAARVCLRVAQQQGVAQAAPLLYQMAGEPVDAMSDPASVTTLFNRVVAYVDRFGS
jgi:DICT domain-containing protein/predicted DNA-binding transcriptional regulator AlpA